MSVFTSSALTRQMSLAVSWLEEPCFLIIPQQVNVNSGQEMYPSVELAFVCCSEPDISQSEVQGGVAGNDDADRKQTVSGR